MTADPDRRFSAELILAADPKEALFIQERLRDRSLVKKTMDIQDIRLIAGADAAYTQYTVYAAVAVMTFPELVLVEKTCAKRKVTFPYIPGLLSFREGPAIIEAFNQLSCIPDLIFVNGQGYAHPKRFGIASHIGVVLDIPAIGVAQNLLVGTSGILDPKRGCAVPVRDEIETIGMAVRTKEAVKPVYVSAGHKVDLFQAVELVLRVSTLHRLPEPLWIADQLSKECKKKQSGG